MGRQVQQTMALLGAVVVGLAGLTTSSSAQSLMERAESGEPIRLGFANEVPWAYPGENNEPMGFANAHTLGVLEEMGFDNIEPVVTDFGGLVPGLKAGRFDVITGGMYIIGSRCENVDFAEPMGIFGDAFIVAAGNPEGVEDYQDIKEKGVTFVTGAGYNTVEAAKQEGVPEEQIMQVPGSTEILAAVRAGRAAAGGLTYFTAQTLAEESGGEVEVTDPAALPDWTKNWVGIAFRPDDEAFLSAFNEAQAGYIGSDAMLEAVGEYGYTEANLPGDQTTEWVCANR